MRNQFGEQLNTLHNELIIMGALCEEAILNAARLLHENKPEIREAVVAAEKEIDQKERLIETLCMKLLMQQQPVAGDFRMVSSALKMISDLERIGDQALDIAEMADHVKSGGLESETHIEEMAQAAIRMVTTSVDSFVKKDVGLAEEVMREDDVVDGLFDRVKEELILAVQERSKDAEALVDLLMIAKYFERIGDHAQNIAEWVIYSLTGRHEREWEMDCAEN